MASKKPTLSSTAAELALAIRKNVDDFCAKRISDAEYDRQKVILWERAQVSEKLCSAVLRYMHKNPR